MEGQGDTNRVTVQVLRISHNLVSTLQEPWSEVWFFQAETLSSHRLNV